jgi:flagellar hook-basal body complex protein FliE
MVTNMRKSLILLPLLLVSTPAFAEPAPQLPPELTDPAVAQKLTNSIQALSGAFLNLRVGEVTAALQGRAASPEERNLTVGDLARRDDPDFDRHLHEQMANVGPTMQRSIQAVNKALPEISRDLKDVRKSIERAMANMPDPNYPKR